MGEGRACSKKSGKGMEKNERRRRGERGEEKRRRKGKIGKGFKSWVYMPALLINNGARKGS